jgi:hypothetical protein
MSPREASPSGAALRAENQFKKFSGSEHVVQRIYGSKKPPERHFEAKMYDTERSKPKARLCEQKINSVNY